MEEELNEMAQLIWTASQQRNACRLILSHEPLPRTVHPYGIARTSKNQIVLVCWQSLGLTRAGQGAGYRNLLMERIIEAEVLDQTFHKREDFNPADAQYKEWVYHI